MHSIKQTFIDADLKQLLLACDLMEPVIATASEQVNLYEAIEIMDKYAMDYLLLVSAHGELSGFLERNMMQKIISTKYLELQKQVEVVG